MGNRTCSIEECGRDIFARKLCQPHYYRLNKYGDPRLGPELMQRFNSVEERFWSSVDKSGDCWVWRASCYHDGYGEFRLTINGRKTSRRAHRMAYEYLVGPIPEGMAIDHLCFNRRCCRPDHLRLASWKQNLENRQGAQSNSQSGIRGVKQERNGRWQGRVRHHGKDINVGMFGTVEEAEAAVIRKRLELFTHSDMDVRSA